MATNASELEQQDPAEPKQQDPAEINELVGTLHKHDRKKPKDPAATFSCRVNTFDIQGTEHTIDSWKFGESDFKKRDLPICARGLFTWQDPSSGTHRIAVRGYDKFFNIDEIYRTKWDWIKENTKAPYELTVKENGCIIFISGLRDGTLLICSKHSTGAREDSEPSHAMVGEKWVSKQLEKVGRTREELAKTLYEMNATAVAELCDDSFEEHILAYEGDNAGLYLHGINFNLRKFATYSMPEVYKFANEWAFRKIDYLVKYDVQELRKFLEEAAETGSWDGKDVEGFVIRSKARNGPNDSLWHDWFFKYKFEEPYLMYRQWRECTKAMIAGRPPRYYNHKAITKEYLDFAQRYFDRTPGAADKYKLNHGIISLRDAFLAHRGLKGSDIIKQESAKELETVMKLVLVPVATIGCGKTTVAHALTKLFGWGHKQNDNITATKGRGRAFATACAKALVDSPVVIADRNNHQKRERKQLIDDMSMAVPNAHFVALHYVHYDGHDDQNRLRRIRETTKNRVFSRGDNHQTIQAATTGRAEVEGIMEGFIQRFQSINLESDPDSGFDLVINLDPTKDSRENLETIVNELRKAYPHLVAEDKTTSEALDAAIKASFEEYKPAIKHEVGKNSSGRKQKQQVQNRQQGSGNGNSAQKKNDNIEYFSITVHASQIRDTLQNAFASVPAEKRAFFDKLEKSKRIQRDFHLTLIHRADSNKNKDLWQKYLKLYQGNPNQEEIGHSKVKLEKVVWDGRVMAIVAGIVNPEWTSHCEITHITIGTADFFIKPKESNVMLVEKWKQGAGGATEEIELGGVELDGQVKVVKSMGNIKRPGGTSLRS